MNVEDNSEWLNAKFNDPESIYIYLEWFPGWFTFGPVYKGCILFIYLFINLIKKSKKNL